MLLCNGPGERWLDPPNHQVVLVSSALARIEDSTSATFLRYIQRDKTSLPIAWGTVRLGGAISLHPQTWCYNAHHDPWSMANSGRRLTTINNTMSCSNDDDLIFYLCNENVLLWLLNHHFLFLMCSLSECFREKEWDRTLLGDLLIKAPHLEFLK